MARSISTSSWTLISALNFGLSCFLKNSLTFAVDASSCYTCVNYLRPIQILVPSCCRKALPFSNAGKLSIRTRQWNLFACYTTQGHHPNLHLPGNDNIFYRLLPKKDYVQSSVKTFSLKEDEKQANNNNKKKTKSIKRVRGGIFCFSFVCLFLRDVIFRREFHRF